MNIKLNKNVGKSVLLVSTIASVLVGCNATDTQSSKVASEATEEVMLYDFENGQIPKEIKVNNGTSKITANAQSITGEHSLRVQLTSDAAGMAIRPSTPFDWSEHSDFNLAFDVTNHGTESVQIDLTINDNQGNAYTRGLVVPVGKTQTHYAKMDGHDQKDPEWATKTEFNFESGFRSNPVTWQSDDKQVYSFWGKKRLNIAGITGISFYSKGLLSNREYTIHNTQYTIHNTQYTIHNTQYPFT